MYLYRVTYYYSIEGHITVSTVRVPQGSILGSLLFLFLLMMCLMLCLYLMLANMFTNDTEHYSHANLLTMERSL